MFAFRRDAPTVLIAAVVVVVAGMALISSWSFARLTDQVERDQFRSVEQIVDASLRGAESRALARAELIADLPAVRAAFAEGGQAGRDRLVAELDLAFRHQRDKHGVDQLQFHLPPATAYLRLQAPAKFGDDISAFRPLVVAVNQDQVARKAPAIARTGPGLFGAVPVSGPDGKHLGVAEIGVDFGPVLDAIKADHGLEVALFVAETPLREFGAPEVVGELLNDHNRVGKFIRFHATHWDLLRALVGPGDLAGLGAPAHYTRGAFDRPFGVVLLPLRNAAGDVVAVVAAAKDFGASRAAAGRARVWQGLLALFAIVALAGVILVVVRGMLLRPLRALEELERKHAGRDGGEAS